MKTPIQNEGDFESVLRKDLAFAGGTSDEKAVQDRIASMSPHITGAPEPVRSSDRYKCHSCFQILQKDMLIDGKCPECGDDGLLKPMCPNDHGHCGHDIIEGLAFCKICGESICPTCGAHDVAAITRITGYMGELSGFNQGKRQEVMDRTRYTITGDSL